MNNEYNHHDMGWLRLVGFCKLYVSFAEYSLFYRALLQKRPMIRRHDAANQVVMGWL